jgi:non-heme chloroperoxidase
MEDALGLGKFKLPLSKLAALSRFRTRAGFELSYRLYPSWSENLIVLFHGIGADSRYLAVLAHAIAEAGLATVVTPDFRGHGVSAGADDNIPLHQLEMDFEELLIHLKSQRAVVRIWLAGHSLGGAFVLKVMSSAAASAYQGGILIAPYLPPAFGLHRPGYGGWIEIDEGEKSVNVQKPAMFQTDDDKLKYSFAYMEAVSPPPDFLTRLKASQKFLLLAGEKDQIFISERYSSLFVSSSQFVIRFFSNENHFSILAAPASVKEILVSLKVNWDLN